MSFTVHFSRTGKPMVAKRKCDDVPTGEEQLEGWHRRLSAITSGTFEKIDHFSLRLWDEWSYSHQQSGVSHRGTDGTAAHLR
ncbi:hypothetical protein PROFUN_11424 [Planoprotostelium fungivorum]|uniref:Uncharacterized protein n=1 Tax=Planoprotostelium fungivorum TaxID=1890364 RepID=A0A2P6NAA5_9EUKA|nr:hypothetical protein PROFUN_11424 [Planoprotostelium fungivorum]